MKENDYLKAFCNLISDEQVDHINDEIQIISKIFYQNKVELNTCFQFYKLVTQVRSFLYKYNLHLVYEPFDFENKNNANWKSFVITNGIQVQLEVFYDSNYSLMRIEDNITALYF